MHALRLVGVTEDGTHLVVTDDRTDFALPIDAALRSALRRDTGHHAFPGHQDRPMSPVEVQALIRAGADAEEAAERAGWSVDKVRRYEGPIIAERQHVARVAAGARLRPKGPASGSPTLLDRVTRRLSERGISIEDVDWDSWRSDDGQWVLELHFEESGRHRRASWTFTKSSMSLRSLDREAARLSDDDPDLLDPGPEYDQIPEPSQADRSSTHYTPTYTSDYSSGMSTPRPHVDEDSDLMATLRSTSRARDRRRGPRRHAVEHAEPMFVESSVEPGSRPVIHDGGRLPENTPVDPAEAVVPATPAPEAHLPSDQQEPVAPEPQERPDPGVEPVTQTDATPDPGAPRGPEAGDRGATDLPAADAPATTVTDDAPRPTGAADPRDVQVPDPGLQGISDASTTPDPDAPRGPQAADEAPASEPPTAGADIAPAQERTDADRSETPSTATPAASDAAPRVAAEDDTHRDPGLDGITPPDKTVADPGAPAAPARAEGRSSDTAEASSSKPAPVNEFALVDHEEPHLPFEDATSASDAAPEVGTPAAAGDDPSTSDAPAAQPASTPEPPSPVAQPAAKPAPRKRTRRRAASAPATTPEPAPAEATSSSDGETITETPKPQPPTRSRRSTRPAAKSATAPAGPPQPSDPASEAAPAPAKKSAPRKQSSRRKGRASVPAWDDIMFGAKPGDEG